MKISMKRKPSLNALFANLIQTLIFLFILSCVPFSIWVIYMGFTHGAYGDPLWFLREE